MNDKNVTRIALVLGLLTGLSLALFGVITVKKGSVESTLPKDAVARVNGSIVYQSDFQKALSDLRVGMNVDADTAIRRHVLERLIEEELLVQQAIELGLMRKNRRVRNLLVQSLMDSVMAVASSEQPSGRELRRFYQRHEEYFARQGRVRVQRRFISVPPGESSEQTARKRARRFANQLRGEESYTPASLPMGETESILGVRGKDLPDTYLPPSTLESYVGPTAAKTAFSLPTGSVSEPIRTNGGFWVLRVVDRSGTYIPQFESIRREIENEYIRRAEERALERYLRQLREDASVQISGDLHE